MSIPHPCRCLPVLGWLLVASHAPAQSVPPPNWPDSISSHPSLNVRPATRLRLGAFVARFEKTTLAQIRDAMRVGTIEHQGDAGESMYWLCYTVARAQPPQRLWITSHGEMGGREHTVGGFMIEEISRAQASPGCPSMPSSGYPLSLDRGIWIGTNHSALLRKLPTPSGLRGDWLEFLYEGRVRGRDPFGSGTDVDFAEISALSARVVSGRVAALQAWKVTAY